MTMAYTAQEPPLKASLLEIFIRGEQNKNILQNFKVPLIDF